MALSLRCYLPWLPTAMFFLLSTTFCTTMVSCHKTNTRYSEHCASFVPEAAPTDPETTTIPFPPQQDGYYLGGDGIQDKHSDSSESYFSTDNRRILLFSTNHVYSTVVPYVYKVEGNLILQTSSNTFYFGQLSYGSGSQRGALNFEIEGFWSKSTGRLCMVGSGTTVPEEGKPRVLEALVKITDVHSSASITSLVRGNITSLSASDSESYFEPISLLIFHKTNYKYTEVSKIFDHACAGGDDVPANMLLRLPLGTHICSLLYRSFNVFQLEYPSDCNSHQKCNPLGGAIGYLPPAMSLRPLQCSEDKQSLRILLEFPNSSYANYYLPFNPNITWIAEGSWDSKKNQLCAVACRINTSDSYTSSHIGDCSMRLSLRFPAFWSIKNTRSIVGQIWSNKTVGDSGYFGKIKLSYKNDGIEIPGLKYNYTVIDKAKASCKTDNPSGNTQKRYPEITTGDLELDMSVRDSKGKQLGWGRSRLLFVGNKFQSRNYVMSSSTSSPSPPSKIRDSTPQNISYNIYMSLSSSTKGSAKTIEISAEGIYDAETGRMCLVGCKNLDLNNLTQGSDSMDCEILINLQFPLEDSNDRVKGHIESKRTKSDPLFFETLSLSAVSFSSRYAENDIWRMDFEVILALVSNTLVCLFTVYQIMYAKKHHSLSSSISLLMLVVLTLGHLIPLVLNFEALFVKKSSRRIRIYGTGAWLEQNEVIVRTITMVAFLLLFRLLLVVWSAKFADENQKASWNAEKKTMYVSLPLYIAGGLIAVFVSWRNSNLGGVQMNSSSYSRHQQALWMGLRSYAGLLLDGFLFPQILLNIFQDSAASSLSQFFYIGNTIVRLAPHAYDLYRAHNCVDEFEWSYTYANPATDYFSTAWDVVIPLVAMLLAAIIYLQQCFGGRFLLPRRLKQTGAYDKIPSVSDP
ncbi:hypothetical protein K2173_009621 [Erythroxylum novogranatense]|uniref:RING-type E3 ubiquitin transferase n=1 Tax=Erythroxylum novogranatense TaxID=1862640 RepID=A0AAV8U4J8_9ROSI|nr:hypothetical protein K2173_009621 [Erythroxylum novogranatense]